MLTTSEGVVTTYEGSDYVDKRTCSVSDCENVEKAKGWCGKHYRRWWLYGNPEEPSRRLQPKLCSVEGCSTDHLSGGYCSKHYARWKKHGDPLLGGVPEYDPICAVESCDNDSFLKGYCRHHYRRQKLYGDPEGTYESRRRYCYIDDCGKSVEGHGLCPMHYARWQRNGDPRDHGSRIHGDDEARFWSYVEDHSDKTECWEWTGGKCADGYGILGIDGTNEYMPRFAYELLIGPISEGLEPDHLCRNRGCVNPWHLEPVTHKVNVLRGESPTAINARKTHCIRGHEFDEENTRIDSRGGRSCKACQKMHDRARHAGRKLKA